VFHPRQRRSPLSDTLPTVAAARLGVAALLRDDRVLRVMIVRNEIPPAFVEWVER
jgi:hypothetical protein